MRSIKVLLLAFVAVLGFSALAASSASALLFLTESKKSLLISGSTTGKQILETAGANKVECETVLVDGVVLHKTDEISLIVFTFHKCVASGSSCNSAGEPAGLIKTKPLRGLLVSLLGGKPGVVTSAESGSTLAEFECVGGLLKAVVTGSVAGEITSPAFGGESATLEMSFTKGTKAGEAGIKDYETESGVVAAKMETTLSGLISEKGESSEEAKGSASADGKIKLDKGP